MKKCIVFTLLSCIGIALYAQRTQPILRIENGMHTAIAKRISADAEGKYLLTCSDDKTGRLWDAASGKLLNTFRIPIGNVDEGKMTACALSPDGKIAALSGWTHFGDEKDCIYIINTQTGEIVFRIADIPKRVVDIKFSPDGKWLVAGLSS